MLGSLFAKTLRDGRPSLAGWSLGLVLISFYLAYVFPFIRNSPELVRVLDSLPPVIRSLIGKANPLQSAAGFFNVQPFSVFAPLLFLIFAVSRGSDTLAGEEERGTLELLLAAPLSRGRLVLEKFAALALELLWLSLCLWGGLCLAASWRGIGIPPARFGAAVLGCGSLGLFFLALAMLAGALFGRRRLSASLVGTFAVVAYLVNAYAPLVTFLRPLQPWTPFFWYNAHAPLINGFRAGPPLLLLALSLGLLLLTAGAFARRQLHA